MKPTAIVIFNERGELEFKQTDGLNLVIIDERRPHDRVYMVTDTITEDEAQYIIGNAEIGSRDDEKHLTVVDVDFTKLH